MNILIIEDDPSVFEVVSLSFAIQWPEITVVNAPTGELGVRMARDEKPDVIILDIGLPGIDGFEVCSQIRAFSSIPIVMLTTRNTQDDRARASDLGINDYISKPFRPQELLERVSTYLFGQAENT